MMPIDTLLFCCRRAFDYSLPFSPLRYAMPAMPFSRRAARFKMLMHAAI